MREAGEAPEKMAAYWNTAGAFDGVYGSYAWGPRQHNGYPDEGVVMSQANPSATAPSGSHPVMADTQPASQQVDHFGGW